jgi:hypothetical protein
MRYPKPVWSAGVRVALRRRGDLARLERELQHQLLSGDELAGGRAGVVALEQVGCVEQLVVADCDGAPQLASVVPAAAWTTRACRAARRCR